MSHTNSTTNYGLPQFITTDKPAWLTDINNAFADIDTAVKNAKTAGDNAQSDATQAITDAGNAQTAANSADSKASGAVASISEAFLDSATYAVGDLVMYNNLLYRCHTAVTIPGAWTGNTNWSRTDVDTIVAGINGNTVSMPSSPYTSGSVAAQIGDLTSNKADKSTTYTKTEVDTELNKKFDKANHVSVSDGIFGNLVQNLQSWLIVVVRATVPNSCCMLVIHRYEEGGGGGIYVKEIAKDTGWNYQTNAQGSVVVTYNNQSTGLYGGAYRLR